MIDQSNVVVGVNSTTLLESRLFSKPTIIPFFAEASDKYKEYIFFQDYFSEFIIAKSAAQLKQFIRCELKNPRTIKLNSNNIINDFLGPFDGKSSMRVSRLLREESNNAKLNANMIYS